MGLGAGVQCELASSLGHRSCGCLESSETLRSSVRPGFFFSELVSCVERFIFSW